MKEIKEVKDLFRFEVDDATYATVLSETLHLTSVHEPLKQFTADDIKAAYSTSTEDLQFVDAVIERLGVIQSKKILVSPDIVAGLMLKRKFIKGNKPIVTGLRKLADKLESGETLAMSEVYNFAVLIHDAVGNAIGQKVDGAVTLYNDIGETKLRAARAAETRKKNEAAKKKADKAALEAEKAASETGKA